MSKIPFLITIPHSGEKVPDFVGWLQGLPESILMCDVDRFVDRLYAPALQKLAIPFVKTEWHRYAVDLNRIPDDIDRQSVEGSTQPAGKNSRGYHWVMTTLNHQLISEPMSLATHQKLTDLIYEPFHRSVKQIYSQFHSEGHKVIYHLDAHSMPSVGTQQHRDPGERRADIVVSDCSGQSAGEHYVDLVISSFTRAGFKVAYNWPYLGGRVTEVYGQPAQGHQALQVELNRSLYMDENTKKINSKAADQASQKITQALTRIYDSIAKIDL